MKRLFRNTKPQAHEKVMKKHEPLRNQTLLPLNDLCRIINAEIRRARPGSGAGSAVHLAADGLDDGQGRCLADRRNHSISNLRNRDRLPWFVDDDPDGWTDPAGTDPAGPAAA